MDLPDELMIDWGNAPVWSTCTVYWPAVQAADVISLAKRLYPTHQLSPVAGDPFTFTMPVTNGFTFVPIPSGTGSNFAGLVTLQLPFGIVKGQMYLITVRCIATRSYQPTEAPPPPPVPQIERPITSSQLSSDSFVKVNNGKAVAPLPVSKVINWRYTAGMFAIRIPVTNAAPMLPIERNIQAIIAWRLNGMATSDRWYNVMQRYLTYLNRIVDGLGGGGLPVIASPIGVVTIPEPCSQPHDLDGCHHHHSCQYRQGCCKLHHRREDSLCFRAVWVTSTIVDIPSIIMDIECARIVQNVASTIRGRRRAIQTANTAIKTGVSTVYITSTAPAHRMRVNMISGER